MHNLKFQCAHALAHGNTTPHHVLKPDKPLIQFFLIALPKAAIAGMNRTSYRVFRNTHGRRKITWNTVIIGLWRCSNCNINTWTCGSCCARNCPSCFNNSRFGCSSSTSCTDSYSNISYAFRCNIFKRLAQCLSQKFQDTLWLTWLDGLENSCRFCHLAKLDVPWKYPNLHEIEWFWQRYSP